MPGLYERINSGVEIGFEGFRSSVASEVARYGNCIVGFIHAMSHEDAAAFSLRRYMD